MTMTLILLVIVMLLCLVFALLNGLHDASSVVATIISCGAATPRQAIVLASGFGLLGAILGGNAVANTISSVINLPANASLLTVLLAAISGASAWNLITWRLGLPSSSTHALIGGLIGAVLISAGAGHVRWGFMELFTGQEISGVAKIVLALIISPFIGFFIAFILEKAAKIIFRNAKFTLNKWLNRVQWLISAVLSFSNGANDTQKIIGIIMLALAAAKGMAVETAPLWVRLGGGLVLFTGTLLGGWGIMKTVGRGIYDLKPIHSVNSQLASAGAIFAATLTGAPVSSTHVVVGSVMGVGAADAYKMVHWKMVREIVLSWLITIPMSALMAAGTYLIFDLFLP